MSKIRNLKNSTLTFYEKQNYFIVIPTLYTHFRIHFVCYGQFFSRFLVYLEKYHCFTWNIEFLPSLEVQRSLKNSYE